MESDLLQNEAMQLGRRGHEPIVDFSQPGKLHKAVWVVEGVHISLEHDRVELLFFSIDADCDPRCGLVEEQFSILPELGNPSRVDVAAQEDRLKVGFRHGLAKQSTKELDEKLAHDLVQRPRLENERVHVQQKFVRQFFVCQRKGPALRQRPLHLRKVAVQFVAEFGNLTVQTSDAEAVHRLKRLTVEVKAGNAIRKYKVEKSDGPEDLVFQGVRSGGPLRDNNILCRFIKPAARTLGLPWVNWRSLRTPHAPGLKMAGADVKAAQAQMRHSRSSPTLDIYQQFVPESQQRAVDKLSGLVH